MHYSKGIFSHEGEVDSPNFYLHSEGKTDLKKELNELVTTLFAQSDGEINDESVICRFPARSTWVLNQIQRKDILKGLSRCTKLNKWFKETLPKSAYIVFSSYYLESPASAFGHTFLRLSKSENKKNTRYNELLDLGLSYGAQVTTENPALYAILGMIGGFKGDYSGLPYYYKIREYSNYETRDLWSYKLNLSQRELEELTLHLWELGSSYSWYYFFTENCSYNVMTLLEAINPDYDLTSKLPYLYVIPFQTIKLAFQEKNLLLEPSYRPSSKKVFDYVLSQLTTVESNALSEVIDSNFQQFSSLAHLSDNENVNVLDTLILYYDYKFADQIYKKNKKVIKNRSLIVERRSLLGDSIINDIVPVPKEEAPHLAHPSKRVDFGHGYLEKQGHYYSLRARFALHDLLDPLVGQPRYAAINFGSITSRLYKKKSSYNFKLQNIDLFKITTLNPLTFKHYPTSLNAQFGMARIVDESCYNCLVPRLSTFMGVTKELGDNILISPLISLNFQAHSGYKNSDLALSSGPGIQLLFRSQYISIKLNLKYEDFFIQQYERLSLTKNVRLNVSNDFSFNLYLDIDKRRADYNVNLMYFF